MRKLTFVLAMSAMSFFAQAQSFKSVKVDFASGYAIPSGDGAKGGIVLAMEPKYAINDKLTFGLRLEAALMAQLEVDQTTGEIKSGSVKALAAYSATGDYFFSANTFRPFGGIGAGLFSVAGVSADATGAGEASGGQKFGFTPPPRIPNRVFTSIGVLRGLWSCSCAYTARPDTNARVNKLIFFINIIFH